jgi:hypothetical protein
VLFDLLGSGSPAATSDDTRDHISEGPTA